MNWGKLAAMGGLGWGLATSLGYLVYGDWRKALYFFLGAAITAVVIWLL
jgi:hypothetical protein